MECGGVIGRVEVRACVENGCRQFICVDKDRRKLPSETIIGYGEKRGAQVGYGRYGRRGLGKVARLVEEGWVRFDLGQPTCTDSRWCFLSRKISSGDNSTGGGMSSSLSLSSVECFPRPDVILSSLSSSSSSSLSL